MKENCLHYIQNNQLYKNGKKLSKQHYLYQLRKKKFNKKHPIITVVTVVKDGGKVLEKTIKNVLSQTYNNLEYVVVYTPGKDNTWNIIEKYKNNINKIVINSRLGIYNAFNVAIKYSTGDWINFMNAGDYFLNKNTVKEVFSYKHNCKVIYSDCYVDYPNFKRHVESFKFKQIKRQMPFSHQSSFVNLKLQKKLLFRTNYWLSADYDFFYRLFKSKAQFKKINKTISVSIAFGIADRLKVLTMYQNYLIAKHHRNIDLKDKIFYFKNIILFISSEIIKFFLPRKIILNILKSKFKK